MDAADVSAIGARACKICCRRGASLDVAARLEGLLAPGRHWLQVINPPVSCGGLRENAALVAELVAGSGGAYHAQTSGRRCFSTLKMW